MKTHQMMKSHQTKAFTLTEILVAVLITGIIALSTFETFRYSTDYYEHQDQVLKTQNRLRFVVDQVKQDFKALGKLSTYTTIQQTRDPKYCGVLKFDSMVLFDNENSGNQPPTVLKSNGNGLYPDRFRAWVDASNATPLLVDQQNGLTFNINPAPFQITTDAKGTLQIVGGGLFDNQYDDKALLRVVDLNSGYYDVVQISAKQFNNGTPKISVAQNTCAQINCNTGRCMVNPLHLIEYLVLSDQLSPSRTALVRRRLDFNGNFINDTDLILAEQVVNFQLWGDYDSQLGGIPTIIADPNPLDDRGNLDINKTEDDTLLRNSRRLRAIKILVSIRQDREDPNFKLKVDNPRMFSAQERNWFALDNVNENGFARVSTMIGYVDTSNLYHGIW